MAKLISDAQTELAYRLGEDAAPTETTELARRRSWFNKAIDIVTAGDEPFWFMQSTATDLTVAGQKAYSTPTSFRKMIQVKVDGYRYDEVPYEEVYEKFELPNSPVPILPAFLARSYYLYQDEIVLIPIPNSSPSSITLTSLTSSGTTCTATYTSHGYAAGDYVTIAGASQTAYNGTFKIVSVPTSSTFTYTAASTPAASPATGTVTATKRNIVYKYYINPTEATAETNSIIVPDEYMDLLTSYGEGRFWSLAAKRGKSADAFAEFQTRLNDLKKENYRRKYLAR